MNKIYTKLRHGLPSSLYVRLKVIGKNINPVATHLK